MSEIASIRPIARWARSTGRRVRGHLAENEVSQEQAAHVLGLSQAAMSRRLSGNVDFTISELLDLAEWLGLPVTDLMPREAPAARVTPAQSSAVHHLDTPGDQLAERRRRRRHTPKLPHLPEPVFAGPLRHLRIVGA